MSTLIWKEYRQNRRMFVAIGLFMLLLYLFCIVGALLTSEQAYDRNWWAKILWIASAVNLIFCAVAAAFIGGNMVAGERTDRSSEFIGYLPIRRSRAIAAKVIVAVSAIALAWLANHAIHRLSHVIDIGEHFNSPRAFTAPSCVLMFGVSTLLSCILRSPGSAAIGGLAAPLALFGSLYVVEIVQELPAETALGRYYTIIAMVIGLTCIIVGVLSYLRRIEP